MSCEKTVHTTCQLVYLSTCQLKESTVSVYALSHEAVDVAHKRVGEHLQLSVHHRNVAARHRAGLRQPWRHGAYLMRCLFNERGEESEIYTLVL